MINNKHIIVDVLLEMDFSSFHTSWASSSMSYCSENTKQINDSIYLFKKFNIKILNFQWKHCMVQWFDQIFLNLLFLLFPKSNRGHHGRDRMVVGFTTTLYLCNQCQSPLRLSSNPVHGEVSSIQHYVIKFVSDLWQVSGFLRVVQFPQPIKMTSTI